MKLKKTILMLFIITIFFAILSSKDINCIKMVFEISKESIDKNPSDKKEDIIYMAHQGVRKNAGNVSYLLFNPKNNLFYMVNNMKKEFSLMDKSVQKKMTDQMDAFLGVVSIVKKESRKKMKLGIWNTFEVIFLINCSAFEMEMKIQFTRDIPFTRIAKQYWGEFSKYQGEMGKITHIVLDVGCMPVKFESTVTMKGKITKSTNIVKSNEIVKVPSVFFDIPAGYKKVPMNPQEFQKVFF